MSQFFNIASSNQSNSVFRVTFLSRHDQSLQTIRQCHSIVSISSCSPMLNWWRHVAIDTIQYTVQVGSVSICSVAADWRKRPRDWSRRRRLDDTVGCRPRWLGEWWRESPCRKIRVRWCRWEIAAAAALWWCAGSRYHHSSSYQLLLDVRTATPGTGVSAARLLRW